MECKVQVFVCVLLFCLACFFMASSPSLGFKWSKESLKPVKLLSKKPLELLSTAKKHLEPLSKKTLELLASAKKHLEPLSKKPLELLSKMTSAGQNFTDSNTDTNKATRLLGLDGLNDLEKLKIIDKELQKIGAKTSKSKMGEYLRLTTPSHIRTTLIKKKFSESTTTIKSPSTTKSPKSDLINENNHTTTISAVEHKNYDGNKETISSSVGPPDSMTEKNKETKKSPATQVTNTLVISNNYSLAPSTSSISIGTRNTSPAMSREAEEFLTITRQQGNITTSNDDNITLSSTRINDIDVSKNDTDTTKEQTNATSSNPNSKYLPIQNENNTSTLETVSNITKELCPETPPKLVGPLAVLKEQLDFATIAANNPGLLHGGLYSPPDCKPRSKVAIVIPFRNRENHLKVLLNNLHPILMRQQLDYGIYIVDQALPGKFNRAMLMNIGFVEAMKRANYQCAIFHDVDLIPEHDHNIYSCPSQPRHMSVAVDKFNYRLPYAGIFGGVSALTSEHFKLVNGFSNLYFGWGGEDDDMASRISARGLKVTRYAASIARYSMIKHLTETENKPNPKRWGLLRAAKNRMKFDGLGTLEGMYKVQSIQELPTHTRFDVLVDDSVNELPFSYATGLSAVKNYVPKYFTAAPETWKQKVVQQREGMRRPRIIRKVTPAS